MNALQARILDVPAPAQVWTYADLTRIADDKICTLLAKAKELGDAQELLRAKIYRDFAQGVFILWKAQVGGQFDEADYNRFEQMLARKVMP